MNFLNELIKLRTLARKFSLLPHDVRNGLIGDIANSLNKNASQILVENAKDVSAMKKDDPLYDRVTLNEKRIVGMIESCHELMQIEDPLGEQTIRQYHPTVPIHLISKAVPLGVVACIYEARPNVTLDLAILCIKSGNICVLKGGSQATHTNACLRKIISDVFEAHGLSRNCCYGFSEVRGDLPVLLQAHEYIDVVIPRGGKGLIDFVRKNSLIPTIETGAGVVHIYLDKTIKEKNFQNIIDVITNAKISRPSVCNALDTLLIHTETPISLVDAIITELQGQGVIIGMLKNDRQFVKQKNIKIIREDDFSTEYLSLRCAVHFVGSLEEAVMHIEKYSSHHSECILTDDVSMAKQFQEQVDSAVVYHNTSTRFSDGGCFGFGAEVGISTQKIHARGPMGCQALTTYKYFVDSSYSFRQ